MGNRWVTLALVFLTRTSMGFQFESVASVAPLMIADLGLSYAQFGTLFGLYVLPGAFFALPGGVIGRRFGERRVVVAGLGLMVAGALLTAVAGGFGTAAAGRLLSGVGAVVMNILLAKMVADWFAGKEVSTAMGVMLTSWPVGLGLAAATLGAAGSWRTAVNITAAVAAAGLLLMLICRDAPSAAARPLSRASLRGRSLWQSISAGFAWGCFNASLVVVLAFAPGLLIARGATLGDAGRVVSLAVWVTILSVPLGGFVTDRLGRPTALIVTGSLVAAATMLLIPVLGHAVLAFCLVGLAVGAPPGGLMALLPRALDPERLATGFGVFYTVFYVLMGVTQPAAGLVRDVVGDPAAPIVLAALVMATTVLGLLVFRRLSPEDRRAAAS